jgi:thiamine-phosphate pyrophosphorylase
MEDAWNRARELARDLSSDCNLSSEHLLLAILEKEPALRAQLEKIGLEFGRLEEQYQPRAPLVLDEPLALTEPTEQVDLARILDASANRAREALRVLEDYCRFVLDDAFLSGELKRLRHELAHALAELPIHHLLEARETERDVGRDLTAPGEQSRHSLQAVVHANSKRLQEAFRGLEEYGKVHNADMGRALERLRYQSYTLERALTLGNLARQRLADVHLCVLITESKCVGPLEWTIKEAAAGGATMIQLREKDFSDRELIECARKFRRWTTEASALFVVNDRPDIARLVAADGVHIGQEDMPVMEARQILGPDKLIGVSTHSMEQVRRAVLDGVSYIGIGPTFPSATKQFAEFPGIEFVSEATKATSLPAFAVGGVTVENVHHVAAAGASRVAVSQAICQSPDPRYTVEELLRVLHHTPSTLGSV